MERVPSHAASSPEAAARELVAVLQATTLDVAKRGAHTRYRRIPDAWELLVARLPVSW
jgi:hypothetical protein